LATLKLEKVTLIALLSARKLTLVVIPDLEEPVLVPVEVLNRGRIFLAETSETEINPKTKVTKTTIASFFTVIIS
jgi:hypothetical protein